MNTKNLKALLDEQRKKLPAALEAVAAAEGAHAAAEASSAQAVTEHRATRALFAAITQPPPGLAAQTLAEPLALELRGAEQFERDAGRNSATAHGELLRSRSALDQVERAISQLQQLLDAARGGAGVMAEVDTISAVISSGQSLSAEIDVGNKSVVGIVVPANWTTAGISLQGSPDGGATWAEVVDQTATAIGCSSLAAGGLVHDIGIDPTKLRGLTSIKIRSGTQASPVNQTNTVALSVITRLAF